MIGDEHDALIRHRHFTDHTGVHCAVKCVSALDGGIAHLKHHLKQKDSYRRILTEGLEEDVLSKWFLTTGSDTSFSANPRQCNFAYTTTREADTNEPGEPGAWNRNVVFTLGISCWECLILHRICVVYSGHGPLGDFTHTTGSVVTNGVLALYCSTNSPSILTFFLPYLLVLSPLTSTSSTTPLPLKRPLKRLLKRPLKRR